MAGMADGMVGWADGIMVKWWEWSNGGNGGRNGCMGGQNNGQIVGMVKWREWRTEWLYGRTEETGYIRTIYGTHRRRRHFNLL